MVENILKEVNALLEGHFLLSSGKHSNKYVQCAKLFQYPEKAEKVVNVLIEKIKHLNFDLIVGPAMGGIIAAYEMARQLNKPTLFTERENNIMTLRRGFDISKGTKVLLMEDVVTTGKSSYETINVIESYGGEVIALSSIVDRTTEKLNIQLYSAIKLDIQIWDEENCPLCKKKISLVKPGSRKI